MVEMHSAADQQGERCGCRQATHQAPAAGAEPLARHGCSRGRAQILKRIGGAPRAGECVSSACRQVIEAASPFGRQRLLVGRQPDFPRGGQQSLHL